MLFLHYFQPWICTHLVRIDGIHSVSGNAVKILAICSVLCQCWTHRDALILGADSGVVAFPGHGGLRVTTWRHALQHSRLTSGHHHIARGLAEIISQD